MVGCGGFGEGTLLAMHETLTVHTHGLGVLYHGAAVGGLDGDGHLTRLGEPREQSPLQGEFGLKESHQKQ